MVSNLKEQKPAAGKQISKQDQLKQRIEPLKRMFQTKLKTNADLSKNYSN